MTDKQITYDGLLAALCAVLGSVAALDIGIAKLTFENVPVVIAGLMFGPVDGMLVGFVGVFMSQLLRYGLDASTPLWIAPYVLSGLVVGLGAQICRFRPKFWQTLVILIIDALVVTGTNTVGLYIYYYYILQTPKETMFAAIPVRLTVSVVKGILYASIIPALLQGLEKAKIYERPKARNKEAGTETQEKAQKVSVIAIISLAISIFGLALYGSKLPKHHNMLFLFVSIIAIILPSISKWIRVSNDKRGRTLELVSIIIASFDVAFLKIIFPELPTFIFFLGWPLCGICYFLVAKEENPSKNKVDSQVDFSKDHAQK